MERKSHTSHSKFIFFLVVLFFLPTFSIRLFAATLFPSLIGNPLEARIGALYAPSTDKMRLDIGASYDLFEISTNQEHQINFGTDFMTYTRLRSEGKLKFPVETSDYFFGVNFSGEIRIAEDNLLSYRVRVAHISSHLVDGYTDPDYIFLQKPFIYSREFVDLVLAMNIDDFRVYAGLNSIFSSQPRDISHFIPQAGVEYKKTIEESLGFAAAYDIKLIGTNSILRATNAAQVGVNYQLANKAGIFIGLYYYSGASLHGMFFDKTDNYLGLGFQVIAP